MQRKKHETDILRLKIILQDLEETKYQHNTGSIDLERVLADIRPRLSPAQSKKFDNAFGFSAQKEFYNSTSKSTSVTLHSQGENEARAIKKDSLKKPNWAKKIYKSIVQCTHPDRFIDFPVAHIKEKYTQIYINTVEAYEKHDIGALLLCAYESDVDYSSVKEAGRFILDSYNEASKAIKNYQKMLGYQWYHVEPEQKMTVLENYLKQLGYTLKSPEDISIIRKTVLKRKVGTRPKKMRVKK